MEHIRVNAAGVRTPRYLTRRGWSICWTPSNNYTQSCVFSRYSVNCARSVVQCHQTHSSHWLSAWWFPGWTTVMPCWLTFRSTLCTVYSRRLMQQHGWSTTWDPQTTSPTGLSVFTGSASHSELNTKSPYWRTKLYMGVHHDTWVLWFRSPIYQAVGHCALPAPVACRCLLSDSPPSVARPSRLLIH